jgi:large subunit ribosomal protein L29
MLKAIELKDQTSEELSALLVETRKQLFELVNKRAREKKIDKPHSLITLRRDIARILTVLRQKELANVEGS